LTSLSDLVEEIQLVDGGAWLIALVLEAAAAAAGQAYRHPVRKYPSSCPYPPPETVLVPCRMMVRAVAVCSHQETPHHNLVVADTAVSADH
jgi:hypothetical protein